MACADAADALENPLAALPEAELRTRVLMHLAGNDRRAAALVCSSWRAAVFALPVPVLRVTKEQVAEDAFLRWLRHPGRAREASTPAPAPACRPLPLPSFSCSVTAWLHVG